MQKSLKPAPMRPIMEDGSTAFSDIRSRIYATPEIIDQYTTLNKSNGGTTSIKTLKLDNTYVGDPALKELVYRSSYP